MRGKTPQQHFKKEEMEMDKKLTGVIMAAGKGTRMEPFSSDIPKPLLPVCNIPLIEYHIDMMKKLQIDEIIIVVGHLSFAIARRIGDGSSLGVKIRYVEQKEHLGIAHAVGKLEHLIHSRFLLFLGDIFFLSDNLNKMVELMDQNESSAVLAVVDEKNPDAIKRNFSIILNDNGQVKRVIEKPRYIASNLKGCGIYLFDPHIFDAIRRTPRTAMRDEYELTDAIQILIEYGFPVEIAKVIQSDINLTYPHDLLRCNIERLKWLSRDFILGENSVLNGAKIPYSVVGENVVIKNPITVKNSLVFPNSILESKLNLDYSIISPDVNLDCRRFFS